MDNVILDQNIQFKCGFSFDLCNGFNLKAIAQIKTKTAFILNILV